MSEDAVLYAVDGPVATVTLNRPDKLNVINQAVVDGVTQSMKKAEADRAVSVVVLRGAGRSFCAGYDLAREYPEGDVDKSSALWWHDNFTRGLGFYLTIFDLKKPVIASVQGHAVGAGCWLTMVCDLTVCADTARFGEPEIRFSSSGSMVLMPWMMGIKRARELIYMGDQIDAETAKDIGLVNRIYPAAELEASTMRYARRLALMAPEALQRAKLAINRTMEEAGFKNALRAGVDVISAIYAEETSVVRDFRAAVAKDGLTTALRNRNALFKE
ncbi:MAG: enoyl-CoA hydratase/isomerase family protein [Alphaproteobacteria bacterium]|nr:enoyl-CoA hydratase/isomerase family protein [Alphaproteobacteria bacterium]